MNTTSQEATRSYDCKFPNCTNEAPSRVGRYSYCVEHRDRAVRERASAKNGGPARPDTTVAQIQSLAALAKSVDRAHARALKLTEQALAAKREADTKAAEFRRAARELLSDEVDA